MKLYFTHYSCVVIILFNTGLQKYAFSTDSFGFFLESSFFGIFLRFFALYRIGFNVIFTNFITFALHNNQCLQKYQVLCVFSLISKKRSCHKHLSIAFNKRTASQRELFEFLILKVFIYKGKCDIH